MAKPYIAGALYAANPQGFKKMLVEANKVRLEGYSLITIMPVGQEIGAVYRRDQEVLVEDNNSFFE